MIESIPDELEKKRVAAVKKIARIPGVKGMVSSVAGSMIAVSLQDRAQTEGLEKFVAAMNQPTRKELKEILDKVIEEHDRKS